MLGGGGGGGGSVQQQPAEPLTTCGVARNLANVLNMGLGFLLTFTAFQTVQGLAAKLLGELGTTSLGILYVAFAGFGFVAPSVVHAIGPKGALVVGASCYILYMVSLIYIIKPLVLVLSALLGVGAATLWCGQGEMLSRCSNEDNKSLFAAICWGLFNCCVVPGNIASHFILEQQSGSPAVPAAPASQQVLGWSDQNSFLFCVLSAVGACGILCMLLLRPVDYNAGTAPIPSDPTKSVCAEIRATLAMVFEARVLLLIPMFMLCGSISVMWSAWFTRQMEKSVIGLVMPLFAVAEIVGGLVIGRISDRCGRGVGFMLGALATLGACATLWLGNQALQESCAGGSTGGGSDSSAGTDTVEPCVDGDYRLFFVAAFLFGLGDCAIQSNTSAICADDFGGRSAEAFALYRTFQAAMSCSLFFLTPLWSTDEGKVATVDGLVIEIAVVAANLLLALLGWAIFDCLPGDREKAHARVASTMREPLLR
eukprot:COSAG02_NODE_34_length_49821_cov_105.420438_44_plen_482_part_00